MQGADIGRLVALAAPVLCVDTCSVLDLMRDPTRDGVNAHERQAALDLLAAMERRRDLVVLLADQVAHEFGDHAQGVQEETARAIAKLKAQVGRIDNVAAVYGSAGSASLAHLDDHATRARAIVDRWMAAATPTGQGGDIPTRALTRLNQARTPARKGKDSMKDCVVIETYLEVVGALRTAGLTTPIVFVSSNTKDYCSETGSALRADLTVEFGAIGMQYAPNLAAAKHLLGCK